MVSAVRSSSVTPQFHAFGWVAAQKAPLDALTPFLPVRITRSRMRGLCTVLEETSVSNSFTNFWTWAYPMSVSRIFPKYGSVAA